MHSLLLALLLSSVAGRQDPAPPAAPLVTQSKAGAQDRFAPYEALAEDVQSAFEDGELAELKECIDEDAVLEKSTTGIDCDPQFRKGFIAGARDKLLGTLLGSVHAPLEVGGSLKLLRILTHDAEPRPLFRLVYADGGVEYLELSVRAQADGTLRVDDWKSYATGEWVSESLHHLYLPFAIQSQRGLVDRLLGTDQRMVENWDTVARLIECVKGKQLEKGLEVYATLPEDLRHDKFILVQRLRLLADHPDHEDYLRVLEDLRRYCPGDPANELHAIDFHYIRKEWKQSAAAVRRLRELVQGDPYLDQLEAAILILAQDLAAARAAIERSLQGEPERLQSHWVLVSICLKQKDHAAVLEALKGIDKGFELKWNDLTQSAEYKDFAASPQHAEWLAYLAAKPN